MCCQNVHGVSACWNNLSRAHALRTRTVKVDHRGPGELGPKGGRRCRCSTAIIFATELLMELVKVERTPPPTYASVLSLGYTRSRCSVHAIISLRSAAQPCPSAARLSLAPPPHTVPTNLDGDLPVFAVVNRIPCARGAKIPPDHHRRRRTSSFRVFTTSGRPLRPVRDP